MSSEAKRVKILTLLELFLGIALVVAGIVFVVMGAATSAPYVLCGEGGLALVYGVRGSLIANVPARMAKLAKFAAVMLLLQVACVVGVVMLIGTDHVADEVPTVALSAVPVVVTLASMLLARGIAKRAER